jgi:SAM-dependent methyltransferase
MTAAAPPSPLVPHRAVITPLLQGEGLEIGALHFPFVVPAPHTVTYLDVEPVDTIRERFPELAEHPLVTPTQLGDVGTRPVSELTGRRFDFIVLNHVLEHVSNPIQVIANVWDGLGSGGRLVLSVPDKTFTYDRPRPLTTFAHLLGHYFRGATEVDDDHYVEFLEHCHAEAFPSHEAFTAALAAVRGRREHAHVWDSTTFRSFLDRTVALLGLRAAWLHESTGATNRFEYFCVLERTDGAEARAVALTVLEAVYRTRTDLKAAFPDGPRRLPRLLAWARDAGCTVDRDAPVLGPHAEAFRALAATTRRAS